MVIGEQNGPSSVFWGRASHVVNGLPRAPLNRYRPPIIATSQGAGFVVGWGAGFAAGMAWYIGRYR